MQAIPRRLHPIILAVMVDENWAFAEWQARNGTLTLAYYLGLTLPMVVTWTTASSIGAALGRSFGDPAAYGFDFAFSALFIGILAGFWRGVPTGAVLGASALAAVAAKSLIPGAWYIVIGGVAGMAAASILHRGRTA
jgi:predicted branched-subunit amino acid permease